MVKFVIESLVSQNRLKTVSKLLMLTIHKYFPERYPRSLRGQPLNDCFLRQIVENSDKPIKTA